MSYIIAENWIYRFVWLLYVYAIILYKHAWHTYFNREYIFSDRIVYPSLGLSIINAIVYPLILSLFSWVHFVYFIFVYTLNRIGIYASYSIFYGFNINVFFIHSRHSPDRAYFVNTC